MFRVHAGDDPESGPEHSVAMYLALKRARVPAGLHVYAAGGHGFGVRKSSQPCSNWTDHCGAWLRAHGILIARSARQRHAANTIELNLDFDGAGGMNERRK